MLPLFYAVAPSHVVALSIALATLPIHVVVPALSSSVQPVLLV